MGDDKKFEVMDFFCMPPADETAYPGYVKPVIDDESGDEYYSSINEVYEYATEYCDDYKLADTLINLMLDGYFEKAKEMMYKYINGTYRKKLKALSRFETTEPDAVMARMMEGLDGEYYYNTYDPNFKAVVKSKLFKSTVTGEYGIMVIEETKMN